MWIPLFTTVEWAYQKGNPSCFVEAFPLAWVCLSGWGRCRLVRAHGTPECGSCAAAFLGFSWTLDRGLRLTQVDPAWSEFSSGTSWDHQHPGLSFWESPSPHQSPCLACSLHACCTSSSWEKLTGLIWTPVGIGLGFFFSHFLPLGACEIQQHAVYVVNFLSHVRSVK